jgi:low temperature requirement protein LtrA
MNLRSPRDLLRARGAVADSRVGWAELFFDLVFVFAITQLSHRLLHDLTLSGALGTLFLLLAVWWVWHFTAWVTNWLDPQQTPVQLLLFALMLAGLVLSMSIPTAFGADGMGFAVAYVAMQVGRSLFMLWALAGRSAANHRNLQRVTAWLALSGAFWLAGGLQAGEARVALWCLALAIEFFAPAVAFWTPGLGRTPTADWNVSGAHMAERSALFIIICLGESIVMTGATFATRPWAADSKAALTVAFAATVAMWWLYFHVGHERATHLIERSADPGRIARLCYTYIHIPLVAGIVLAATSDKLLLAHPAGTMPAATAAAVVGGPALFVAGNLLFNGATGGRVPLSHLVGLALLGGAAMASGVLSTLALGAIVTAVLILIAAWERLWLGPRGDPLQG